MNPALVDLPGCFGQGSGVNFESPSVDVLSTLPISPSLPVAGGDHRHHMR